MLALLRPNFCDVKSSPHRFSSHLKNSQTWYISYLWLFVIYYIYSIRFIDLFYSIIVARYSVSIHIWLFKIISGCWINVRAAKKDKLNRIKWSENAYTLSDVSQMQIMCNSLKKLRNVIQAHQGFTACLLTSFKSSLNAQYRSSKLSLETHDSFQKESVKSNGLV